MTSRTFAKMVSNFWLVQIKKALLYAVGEIDYCFWLAKRPSRWFQFRRKTVNRFASEISNLNLNMCYQNVNLRRRNLTIELRRQNARSDYARYITPSTQNVSLKPTFSFLEVFIVGANHLRANQSARAESTVKFIIFIRTCHEPRWGGWFRIYTNQETTPHAHKCWKLYGTYSYFKKRCRKKAQNCTSQSWKVVWVDVLRSCTSWMLIRYNNKVSANFRFSFFSDM